MEEELGAIRRELVEIRLLLQAMSRDALGAYWRYSVIALLLGLILWRVW